MNVKPRLSDFVRWVRGHTGWALSLGGWIEKHSASLNVVLTLGALVVGYYLLMETQRSVDVASNTWRWQRESDSAKSVYERWKDSVNAFEQRRVTDSSLAISKSNVDISVHTLKTTQRSAAINEEISKTSIQPYIFLDSVSSVSNVNLGAVPVVYFQIANVGATPAYKIGISGVLTLESDFTEEELSIAHESGDTVGFFLGKDKSLTFDSQFYFGERKWQKEDFDTLKSGKKIFHFLLTIFYEDGFGRPHFTQYGYVQGPYHPTMVGLRRYFRTDRDEENKTTKTNQPKARKAP